MASKFVRIVNKTGRPHDTKVTDEDGHEIRGICRISWEVEPGTRMARATIEVLAVVDVVGEAEFEPIDITPIQGGK